MPARPDRRSRARFSLSTPGIGARSYAVANSADAIGAPRLQIYDQPGRETKLGQPSHAREGGVKKRPRCAPMPGKLGSFGGDTWSRPVPS